MANIRSVSAMITSMNSITPRRAWPIYRWPSPGVSAVRRAVIHGDGPLRRVVWSFASAGA
jgi:hypothetical protein